MPQRKLTRKKPKVADLLNRFADEEAAFLQREFLAPALRGGVVGVRIGGVHCRVHIAPANFEGWGVFQPVSHTKAKLVRQATLSERRAYLKLFPLFRQIVCRRAGNTWFGAAASFGDSRLRMEGLAPLQLAEEVQLFDCVRTRYDGSRFWFDEADMRHDPGTAAYLRSSLNDLTSPDDLERSGLTVEERAAYELNFWERVRLLDPLDDEQQRNPAHRRRSQNPRGNEPLPTDSDPVRHRLRENLSHAGAQLVDYLERSDSYRVYYRVGGRQYTSSVDKEDLTVQVAGICLSGQDRKFDLGSLVGVLREGERGGDIYEVGEQGMSEEEYWDVHPPQDP